ncbi:MAG TPA: MFS transporter [Burkholderiales bacterium]|nr:MFS transporter [Burkholderiales bacterium]
MPRALPVVPVLFFTTTTQALATLGILALAAVAPRAAQELGISAALVGYQVALSFFGGMQTALFGGGFVRRLGAARTSQLALWLIGAGAALSALGSLATLAAGALVMGWGYGVTNPAASHLLSRAPTTRNMNLIFSIKQCGVPLGAMLAGFLMPPITLWAGWRAALFACAVMSVAFSLFLQPRRSVWDDDRDEAARLFASPLASLSLIWGNKVLRWLALCSFLYSAVQLCLSGFLVTFLVEEVHLQLVLAGTLLAVTHAAGAAGRLVWGWIADRLRSGTLALILNGVVGVLGALATAAMAPGWPAWAIALAGAIFGFSSIGWNGVFMAVIARQAPRDIGAATGGSLFFTYAGVVIVPSLFAQLHERAGMSYGSGFGLLALLTAAGVGCLAMARRHVVNRM